MTPTPAGTGKAEYKGAVLGKGLPASPGAAVGRVVFTADEAEKWNAEGEKVRAACVLARRASPPRAAGAWSRRRPSRHTPCGVQAAVPCAAAAHPRYTASLTCCPSGHPGAPGDQPRGRGRHARRAGHPDRARRHDQPRRRGGARLGQALRVRPGQARGAVLACSVSRPVLCRCMHVGACMWVHVCGCVHVGARVRRSRPGRAGGAGAAPRPGCCF